MFKIKKSIGCTMWSITKKTTSSNLLPDFVNLGSISLTKVKQLQTLRYFNIGLWPFQNSKGINFRFLWGTQFNTQLAVKIVLSQRFEVACDSISMTSVNLTKILFFLSATPLDEWE